MIFAPTNRRVIRPGDKPSFEHTQKYGLIKGHWANVNCVARWLFNEGSGGQVLDLSGNGLTGTFNGDIIWSPGKFDSCPDFPGVTNYITAPLPSNFSSLTTITFLIWVKSDVGNAGEGQGVFRIRDTRLNMSYGKVKWTPDVDGGDQIDESYTIAAGEWYQIAVTQTGTDACLYINGVLIGSGTVAALDLISTYDVNIGNYNAAGGLEDLDGQVDIFSIYNRAFTPSEVFQLNREPFLGIEKRTAPIYFFVPTGVAEELAGLIEAQSALTGDVQSVESLAGSVSAISSLTGNITGADWIGISSAHLDSVCGEEVGKTLAEALDGTDAWSHEVDEIHWFIINLLQTYDVQSVRARSNSFEDPTAVNVYINDTGEAPWGDAVASGITTWQDTVEWVEVEAIGSGRYVKVEITGTEYPMDYIVFGDPITPFTIFDVYGEASVAEDTLAGTVAAQSGLTGNIETTDIESLAGLVEAAGALTGNIKTIEALAGLVSCQSSLTGNVNPLTVYTLAGLVAGQSALTGNIKTLELLGGLIEAQAGLTGNLQLRYAEIPPEMHKDLIDPYASGAWLQLVKIVVPGYDAVKLARNTKDVVYGEQNFEKFNLQIGEQTFSSDGSIPRVTLRVFQDINRKVEDIVNATEGALGAAIKLIRVNEKWLDTPVIALEADYDNLASESDSEWVTFTLGIPNPLTQRFPLRNYSSSMCPSAHPDLFKGPDCQYPGEDTSCLGTYEACYTKGNAVHWGAELGLDPSVAKGRK